VLRQVFCGMNPLGHFEEFFDQFKELEHVCR
jgi:hypothetical protein